MLHQAICVNGSLPRIDAVFLNGGMTRFLPVQQRLHEFFGKEPLTLLDPDLSVALGASLYHYALHQGYRPRSVTLAESLGIELDGHNVKHLVRAGTVLPMPKPVAIDGLLVPKGASQIHLPFYRGERTDTQFPNIKLLERVVDLPFTCPQNEPLKAEVQVDANKTLIFRGFLESAPAVKILVTVGGSGELQPGESRTSQPRSPELPPSGLALDVDKTIEQLLTLQAPTETKIKHGIEAKILQASNRSQFIAPLAKAVQDASPADLSRKWIKYRRAMLILGQLGSRYPDNEATGYALSTLMAVSKGRQGSDESYVNHIVESAVIAMGKLQSSAAEPALVDLLNDRKATGAHHQALVALAKVSCSPNAVATVSQFLGAPREVGFRQSAAWALGRLGSRDREPPMQIRPLLSALDLLVQQTGQEQWAGAKQMMVYALGEICDQRHPRRRELVPAEYARKALEVLETSFTRLNSQRKLRQDEQDLKGSLRIAMAMVKGQQLEEEDERVLLKLRSKLVEEGADS